MSVYERILDSVITGFDRLDRALNAGVERNDYDKFYPYLPLPPRIFLPLILRAHAACDAIDEKNCITHTFLEVGCGTGSKLAMASAFFNVSGIEINKDLVEIARKTNPNVSEKRIHHCNALEFPEYRRYEVIYFYTPCSAPELQAELEEIIYSQMHKNAILIAVGCQAMPSKKSFSCLASGGGAEAYHGFVDFQEMFIKSKDKSLVKRVRRAIKKVDKELAKGECRHQMAL